MITATARKHIVRALRDALRIREGQAREILTTIRNDNMLRLLGDTDMRTVKALIANGCSTSPHVGLYVDGGQGYEYTGVELTITAEDAARWNALGLEEAYAIAADVHTNRGPLMQAADDRMAAEAAAEAMNDNDLLQEEEMDRVFGPVTESGWTWTDGTVRSAVIAASEDHVVAMVEVGFGGSEPIAMTMLPLFGNAQDLLSYVQGRIDVPARLCINDIGCFDAPPPAGVNRSLPVLDMIIPQSKRPTLACSLRHAA